jgi:hypothetical protein
MKTIETNSPNCYPTPRMSSSQQTKIKQQTNLTGLNLGLPPLTHNREGAGTLALMLYKNTSMSVWFLFHLCGPNNHLGIMLPLF